VRATRLAVVLACLFAATAGAQPRCYGAASRDPRHPCHNARLDHQVTPTPAEAVLTPNVACAEVGVEGMPDACVVGAAVPAETVAVLGDSHGMHWRAAMRAVARRKRWRVVEHALGHCPFTFALQATTPEGAGGQWCVAYDQSVIDWLAAHPEIHRVFVANKSRVTMVESGIAYREAGDLQALRALPASVARIYVIRDIPLDRTTSHRCVEKALARHQAPGPRCAVPRSALVQDPTASAARQLSVRGARVIDLTRFFCSERKCFPVVGGVLTHKDRDHMTREFSATLAPYLERAVHAAG
jgi:hypothetical protein